VKTLRLAGTLYRYDAAGETEDRSFFDERPKGFAFLAVDENPAELYIKASEASGDRAGPFSYGADPEGPPPAIDFEPVVTGAPGTNASMTVSDPYEITFTIPAGDLGINWRGSYSGVAAYAARDGVLNNGSAWIAKQETTGNAPPSLSLTENDYWSLVAAKGTDGTGTGDVTGPAASVDGNLPAFSGTGGKTLVDSGRKAADMVAGPAESVNNRVAAFSGTSGKALQDSGIILGDAAAKNTGTAAGTVAAGDDARLGDNAKLSVEDETLTGGARVTSMDLGTITTGTVTLDPGDRALQHYANNGAHSLAPGLGGKSCSLLSKITSSLDSFPKADGSIY
jgi:hypothetical protein